jgi:hypothetical protein
MTPMLERYGDHTAYRSGVAAILAQKAARPAFRYLWDAEVAVYSQFGEDGILDLLCDRLGLHKPRAVELGAGNFLECNTRFLAEYRGASVLAVDARPDLRSTVERLPVFWRSHLIVHPGWITPDTAPRLLDQARAEFGGIDIVSLDIDGNDYWVAQEFELHDVSVVTVEYNSVLSRTKPVTVPRDDAFDRTKAHFSWLYFGASLHAFVELFGRRGFTLVGVNRVANNAFFVRDDLVGDVGLPAVRDSDFDAFTDWRVRESRDERGNLSHASGVERVALIGRMPLVDVVSGELTDVAAANTA